jgi:lysophospholipase L1-like esterase
MKKLRATSPAVKKARKTPKSKLTIFLVILPIVVIITTVAVWFFIPAGAQNQTAFETLSDNSKAPAAIDKISLPLNAPEPESQEQSAQIAEQKRQEEAEKKRLEAERILALKKALEIKQARDEARNKICFIGDSITHGGIYGVRGAADRTIDILNAGHSAEDPPYDGINIGRDGSTTSEWVGSIGPDAHNCNKSNLKAVLIMLGTNDAGLTVRGLANVTSDIYLSNMAHIKSVVSGLGVPVVVSCPIMLDSAEGRALITEYCSGLGANGISTPLVLTLPDSIHPDDAGYNAIASAWAGIIRSIVGV